MLSPESSGAIQDTIAGIKMMEVPLEEDLTTEDALPPPPQQNLLKWAQGIKNSVILIDEPNSLHPDVVSALHELADHSTPLKKLIFPN